ncbi:MAG: hypothetical protein AB7O97_22525 [Planctomycetota bacterium]
MTSLRAAFGLLLALALVAGQAQLGRERSAVPAAGACYVVDAAAGVLGHDRPTEVRPDSAAAEVAAAPSRRPLPRWLDLRAGGLPAPRAPDRAPAATQRV